MSSALAPDRDELHAARRAIMEAFEARSVHGPYGWLIMPEGLSEEHWQLSNDPEPGTPSEPLFAKRELVLGDAGAGHVGSFDAKNAELTSLRKRVSEMEAAMAYLRKEMRHEQDIGVSGFEDWIAIIDGAALLPASKREAELVKALTRIGAPHGCGCVPCVGQCRSQEALEIEVDALRDIARAAIHSIEQE